jgi:hypothetical protein
MERIQAFSTAYVNISSIALKELDHRHLLPKNCIMKSSESFAIFFVHPLLFVFIIIFVGVLFTFLLIEVEYKLGNFQISMIS